MSSPSPYELEEMKKTLFRYANLNMWKEVIETYQKKPEAHTAKINSSGDTALHIAISNGEDRVVEKLIAVVSETKGALEIKNELGNTPLHLAAYLGNAKMCSSIAGCNSRLMGLRNGENETPFFLAVRLGRKEAFLAMHNICGAKEGYNYCRGKDGETILHSAISEEFFDLAVYIMYHYENLPNAVTAKGFSPLHILANKPSVFRSGSQIRGLDKLIYLSTFFNIAKLIYKAVPVILGLGLKSVERMREMKEKHIWSLQIMQELLEHSMCYLYEDNGKNPSIPTQGEKDGTNAAYLSLSILEDFVHFVHEYDGDSSTDQNKPVQDIIVMEKKETPILTAARNGITEMVERVLNLFPVSIHDMNTDGKNIVLVAVENRHLHLYKFLLKWKVNKFSIFRKTDKDGNSALHLAARLGEYRPWLTPGVILPMQWERKWYEFVKNSMPPRFFQRYNNESKTATEIFSETHHDLAAKDSEWLSSTSNSCSVVAALVATVAFTASTAIPGRVKSDDTGTPALQNDAAFTIFAISSLVALGFSVTSVVMFLAILTGRYVEKDFRKNLPMKLLVGLTSLLISIACMMLSFCAGHFLVLKDKFELYASLPLYVVTCLPLTFFAILQFPQYVDLVIATISKVPQRFPSSDRMPFVIRA